MLTADFGGRSEASVQIRHVCPCGVNSTRIKWGQILVPALASASEARDAKLLCRFCIRLVCCRSSDASNFCCSGSRQSKRWTMSCRSQCEGKGRLSSRQGITPESLGQRSLSLLAGVLRRPRSAYPSAELSRVYLVGTATHVLSNQGRNLNIAK